MPELVRWCWMALLGQTVCRIVGHDRAHGDSLMPLYCRRCPMVEVTKIQTLASVPGESQEDWIRRAMALCDLKEGGE